MSEYMCPNCITPWKCNGPHIPETTSDTPRFDKCPECGYPHHDMSLYRENAALRADIERHVRIAAEAQTELESSKARTKYENDCAHKWKRLHDGKCEELAAALVQRDCRILELQLELGEGQ